MPVRLLLLFVLCALFSFSAHAEIDRVAAFHFLDRFQSVKVLKTAQDVSGIMLETGAKEEAGLADLKGKWVIMNIWATWCSPCIEEMPKLDRLKMMRGAGNFDVLAVSIDLNKSGPRIAYFLKRWNIKYLKPLYDDTRAATETLDTHVLPVTYVINPEGRAVAALYGPANWSGENALAFVDTLLAEPNLLKNYENREIKAKKP